MAGNVIHVIMHDNFKCTCGNNTATDGFVPCDTQGNEVEPLAGGEWDSTYRCYRCGVVYKDI